MFRLSQEETQSLVRQPESGMGYQVVEAVTTDFKRKRGIVFNAELLALDEERQTDRLVLMRSSALQALKSASRTAGRFRSFSVVRDHRTTVLSMRAKKAGGANEAATEETKDGDSFHRFSAFENDHRVTADRSLLPGTYATTEEDGSKVESGTEAVERYALPNDDPASFRFTVKPMKDTTIQKGIVQPANGHQGGGVEVVFTDGTQKDTVTLPPTQLPDD